MSAAVDRALSMLRDIPGVDGSFLVDAMGTLVARDAAMGLPEWLLAGAATRLANLVESSEDAFEAPREMTLVFGDRSLMVRVSAPYLLALLVSPTASMEAVRLASAAALRQIVRALSAPVVTLPSAGTLASERLAASLETTPTPSSAASPIVAPGSVTMKSGPALPRSTGPTSSPVSKVKPVASPPASLPKKKKSDIWG